MRSERHDEFLGGEGTGGASVWETLSPSPAPRSNLCEDVDCDLAIVGAGFLGLSTALHAARAGLNVRILEAAAPGCGASGRNTGFVVPSLKSSIGPKEAERDLGPHHAARLLELVAGSSEFVFRLIRDEDIDCNARQAGWLQPAHCTAAERMLQDRLPRLQAAGVDANYISRAEMRALTGLPRLHGGLVVASGGQIDPLSYARGLAVAAERAGATINERSPVMSIVRAGPDWRLRTPGGTVTAARVLLATNAMAPRRLSPTFSDSLIPARVFQVATQVLPEALHAQVLPTGAPVADTRRHTFALRWSPDGRLITGGLVPPLPGRRGLAARGFLRRIARMVPGLPPLRAEFVWTGMIAGTPDFLPRMVQLGPGYYGAMGCNGRGVALTTALGRHLAAHLAGATEAAEFVLPIKAPSPVPLARLSGLGPHLWLPWSNLADTFEAWRDA